MELQQPEVVGFGAAPWKSNISVDDKMMKKKNNVAYKYKRSSEEAQHDSYNSSSSSSILLVWSGQPNEDDDDNQPRKLHKPSNCTTSFINKDEGEGRNNDGVVGWPPVKTWRKKLLYQHHAPQHPQMNASRRSQEQGKWNIKHVLEN